MIATGRLKEARRAIVQLEDQNAELQRENEELRRLVQINRTDYETVNEKLMELHRFVKEISEGRSKHAKDAQRVLMD